MKQLSYYLSDEFLSKLFAKISDQKYLIAILIFGLIVRGRQYLTNRSFWLDEAFLANNFKTRGFMELLQPLDYSQVAPIGFLWTEKLMANLFGLNEFALRLTPFLASIAAIYILFDLSRILISKRWGLIIAFAFTLPLTITYFSSELKQYMTDLFIALFLFWTFFKFVFRNPNSLTLFILGVIGAICIWFSNIAPIILFSLGFGLWIPALKELRLRNILVLLTSNLIWLISFFTYYSHFIKDNPHRAGMVSYWSSSFMPHHFKEALTWIYASFDELFRFTASHNEVTYLAIGLFIVGVFSVFVKKSKWHHIYLVLPIVIHLALSYLQIYPFSGRLILYSIPFLILFEFIGIKFIASFFKRKKAVVMLLSLALLLPALLRTARYFARPMMGEDIKPVLQYVSDQMQQDDIVYIYSGGHAAFKFYREKYFTENNHCIVGISSGDDYDKFKNEFDQLESRIWIVFSHMNPVQGIHYLNEKMPTYEQLDFIEVQGAKAYLINKQ